MHDRDDNLPNGNVAEWDDLLTQPLPDRVLQHQHRGLHDRDDDLPDRDIGAGHDVHAEHLPDRLL